jgi:hypothetical protein
LTTFIDHRQGKSNHLSTKLSNHLSIIQSSGLSMLQFLFSGRAETEHTTNNGSIAKKVLDDIRSIPPTERLSWGSRQCRVNRSLRTSRRIISLYRRQPFICAADSDEPFKPLNLTYSLFKELPKTSGIPAERG